MVHQLKQPNIFIFVFVFIFLLEMHDAELRIEHWKHIYNMLLFYLWKQ
jgi:hypothetical protein